MKLNKNETFPNNNQFFIAIMLFSSGIKITKTELSGSKLPHSVIFALVLEPNNLTLFDHENHRITHLRYYH